jgi:peroxiredoxin
MSKHLVIALALALPLAAGVAAEEKPAAEAKPASAALGQKVPDFTIADEAGREFQLHRSTHTRQEIVASVQAAAAKCGATKGADPKKTKLASLAGLRDEDGEIDGEKRRDLANEAGAFYGVTATEETAAAFETLEDLVAWIVAAERSPIVFVIWSPNCPAVKGQNDRLVEFAAASKARVFAIASNTRDTDEHYAAFREAFEFPIRVFPDRDQRVTDILGGKKTPQYLLVGPDHVLRYNGALDNDAMGHMPAEEREGWLLEAVEAVRAGKPVPKAESDPAG